MKEFFIPCVCTKLGCIGQMTVTVEGGRVEMSPGECYMEDLKPAMDYARAQITGHPRIVGGFIQIRADMTTVVKSSDRAMPSFRAEPPSSDRKGSVA